MASSTTSAAALEDAPQRLPLIDPASLGPRLALWLAGAYVLLMALGVAVLMLPGATIRGNEMSLQRAVFTAVNAATLTGFQQAVPLDDYGPSGKVCVIVLTAGGTIITLLIGGLALVRAARMPYTDSQVIRATLFACAFLVGCGAAVLVQPGRGLTASLLQAVSALGNSGLYLERLPGVLDWRTHAALLPLALLGGLSIPVLMELTDAVFARRRLTTHSLVVLAMTAAVYLLGLSALLAWPGAATSADGGEMAARLASASALSIDSRTAGLPLAPVGGLTRAAQWLLIVLMLVGGAPGGTAGGMKVTALFHFVRGTRAALGRRTGLRVTGIAATWIAAYLLMVLATLIALLATLPEMAADRLVFLAVSAVGNVGLSHDPVSVTGPGLMVLAAASLAGRAAPLLVLWWCAQTCNDADVGV